jgi:hypothetical protein
MEVTGRGVELTALDVIALRATLPDADPRRDASDRMPAVVRFGDHVSDVASLALAARIAAGDRRAAADLGSLVGRSLVKSR